MDTERKINFGEGVPLNSTGAANIFLNTGKNTKANSPDGTVIHLKTEKPADLGVHINTTYSIASSKKIKLLFVLNFLLSVLCMVVCCSIAFYYWSEMVSMRRQMDFMREHLLVQNLSQERLQSVPQARLTAEARDSRMDPSSKDRTAQATKQYFVEDLGDDMLLVDSKKKNSSKESLSTILQRELLVAQFIGAIPEHHMGEQRTIGPWVRDVEVSSKGSVDKIELTHDNNYFIIKESGLYLIYTQVVYLTQSPNSYYVFARRAATSEPRHISTCASGDDSTNRSIDKSQISCSTQAVARLHAGDTVNMAQRERNRTIWLKEGYSYIGFVKLSS